MSERMMTNYLNTQGVMPCRLLKNCKLQDDKLDKFHYEDQTKTYSFGFAERFKPNKTISPGPGHYQFHQKVGNENPKFTMASVRPNTAKNTHLFNPAPGEYSYQKKNLKRPQSFKFNKTSRFFDPVINEKVKVPGPQDYVVKDIEKYKNTKWTIRSSCRGQSFYDKTIVPGPGEYNTQSKSDKKHKYSFTSRIDYSKFEFNTPGVGGYTPNQSNVMHKHPTWKFGSNSKAFLYKNYNKYSSPAPGLYNIKSTFQGGTSNKFGKPYKDYN